MVSAASPPPPPSYDAMAVAAPAPASTPPTAPAPATKPRRDSTPRRSDLLDEGVVGVMSGGHHLLGELGQRVLERLHGLAQPVGVLGPQRRRPAVVAAEGVRIAERVEERGGLVEALRDHSRHRRVDPLQPRLQVGERLLGAFEAPAESTRSMCLYFSSSPVILFVCTSSSRPAAPL